MINVFQATGLVQIGTNHWNLAFNRIYYDSSLYPAQKVLATRCHHFSWDILCLGNERNTTSECSWGFQERSFLRALLCPPRLPHHPWIPPGASDSSLEAHLSRPFPPGGCKKEGWSYLWELHGRGNTTGVFYEDPGVKSTHTACVSQRATLQNSEEELNYF